MVRVLSPASRRSVTGPICPMSRASGSKAAAPVAAREAANASGARLFSMASAVMRSSASMS